MERRNGLPQNSGLDEQLWLASQNGDSEALRHLITRYDRLATSLCGSYCAAGMEREDLLQEAYLGLLKAIRSFQPEKGIPFSAFAGLCMKRQRCGGRIQAKIACFTILFRWKNRKFPVYRPIGSRLGQKRRLF